MPSAGSLTDEYLAGYADYYAKDFDRAVYHLVRAVAERTDNADAYYLLARAQWRRGDLKSALGAFQNVVRLQPGCAPALADLAGLLLEDLGNVRSAEKFSRHAIEADPLYAPGFVIQGNVLLARGDDMGAADSYRQAASLNPRLADPLINLGVMCLESGDTAGAFTLFERGLALDPSHANGLWNRGNLLLLLGRLQEGWPGYEQRFQIRGKSASRLDPARARVRWDGSRFDGKTLLVYCEQGLGDTLQFVRYLPLVSELGGTIIFECQDELRSVIGKNFISIQTLKAGGNPVFDLTIPLLSLPEVFRTAEETIPNGFPYIRPDPALSAEFKSRFDPGKFNVGVVWAGNPAHPNDGNRSCSPGAFEFLAGIAGVQLYSLQMGAKTPGRVPVIDLADYLSDFDATASIMEHLDLVITVDTAVAHLAGAMGKPVWVLLPHVPDWRWQLVRGDSPWYPTMRLFRQSAHGDWSGVMNNVAAALVQASNRESPQAVDAFLAPGQSSSSAVAPLFVPGSAHRESIDNDGRSLQASEPAPGTDPDDAEMCHRAGSLRQSRGDLDEAIRWYRRAITLNPDLAETWSQLGIVLALKGLPEEACRAMENALRIKPDFPEVLNNMGMVMKERGQVEIAEKCFHLAIRSGSDYSPAYNNLGTVFAESSRFAEAADQFREATRLSPEYHLAWSNLGNALAALGKFHEAEQIYRAVIAESPTIAEVHFNLAATLHAGHRFEESVRCYDEALRLRPGYAEAGRNRALVLLLRGEFKQGWQGYESRLSVKDPRSGSVPPWPEELRWVGSDIRGKRILVRSEQGFGDTIQFARYIPMLVERGATVLFECPNELCSLFRGFPGVDTLIEFRAEPPSLPFDRYVQLLSLPGLLGTHSIGSIPWPGPYIQADPAAAESVRGRFDDTMFNVGIVWGGNPGHKNNHNRSCSLEEFLPLLDVPGVRFFSLQKGKPVSQLDSLPAGVHVENLEPLLTDFSMTAAVVSHLDLVIAIDTSVAHLAGAMGRPVWTVLPFTADWRWLLDRTDSPWYPTMRLFRQSVHGDWSGVMSKVAAALVQASHRESPHAVDAVQVPDQSSSSAAASLFALGSTHFDSGDNDGALRSFREALVVDCNHAESRNALGVVLASRGEIESAAAELTRAIALDPGRAEAHYNLGNVRKQQGNLEESAACYRAALAIDPGFLQAHVNLGCVLNEQGDPASALEEYRNALAQDPTSAPLLKHVGSLCLVLHDDEGALQAFERALGTDPNDAEMCHRAGSLRQSRGDLDEAIRWYRRALTLNPDLAETWSRLGTALVLKGLPEEAYRALENALRIKPDFPEVLNNMGMVMKERGQVEIAEKCFRMAIRSSADYSPAYNNLGTVFLESSRFAEAADQFREATRLSPDYHMAWSNLGNALAGLGNFHEAKQIYRAVIAENPTIPEVHFNLAASLQHEHRFEESVRCYDEALRLRPGYAEARLNRALVLLLGGKLEEGWQGYECRFTVKDPRRAYVPPGPEELRWDGSDIRGKRILVRPEQGFGDTIQFARYIPMLVERGATVLFECPKELCSLFRGFPGVDTLIEFRGEPPSLPFDRYVQLLSLPGLLGTRSVESIPWPGPYIHADPAAVESVRGRFDDTMFNVGIVWGGNPGHKNDHNRSCSLEEFLPLLDVPGVRFFSLQKGKPVSQLDSLPAGVHVENLEPLLTDFSMTAVVLAHLDLVIAVDTSVAHLAGAMGRPVWTVLPFRPDWRWLLDRTDSPWYPTMRLFRQSAHGDWSGVIREVRSTLIKTAGS